LPTARRQYHVSLNGRVDLHVKQYQAVEVGDRLFSLDSPEWHRLRLELEEDSAKISQLEQEVIVAQANRKEAETAASRIRTRIEDLKKVDVRRIEIETQLAEYEASLPRLAAQIQAKQKELDAAREHLPMEIEAAATLLGTSAEKLTENTGTVDQPKPRWRTISKIDVLATQSGVIDMLNVTNGSWVEANTLVLTTLDNSQVRFRAVGLQSDIAKLKDGLPVRILPPQQTVANADESISGQLIMGVEANPDQRTVELIAVPEKLTSWARPGVSSLMEITYEGSAPELAIPLASVVQDGLSRIYFRRDPKNPDKVIRVEGDFGISDGKWIVVKSGVKAGDEVILDGVYELKLTGSGKTTGGHFHADGTWHADGTPEPK
jgi:multidrug efflux pump subunit AcrA (membrane-fusion protein)